METLKIFSINLKICPLPGRLVNNQDDSPVNGATSDTVGVRPSSQLYEQLPTHLTGIAFTNTVTCSGNV